MRMKEKMEIKKEKLCINNNSRNYGIDALRIISMLMVVIMHVLVHGEVLSSSKPVNYWIAWFLEIASYCAVNCYALISGYVGVNAKYKISNLAILWLRVFFYLISITAIFKLFFPDKVSYITIKYSFFPILSNYYWYFTAYAFLFLLIPVLNEGINNLSKNTLRFVLISAIIISSVASLFSRHFGDVFGLKNGYSVWWLMILYLIGAYIRKYGLLNKIRSHRVLIAFSAYFVFIFITWFTKLSIQLLSKTIFGNNQYTGERLVSYQSITILGAAVSLFLFFETIKLNSALVKAVGFLSPLAFSVYLIHEHPLIRELIISKRFKWIAGLPAYQLVPAVLAVAICIYLICSLIDLLRQYLFDLLGIRDKLLKAELKIKSSLRPSR